MLKLQPIAPIFPPLSKFVSNDFNCFPVYPPPPPPPPHIVKLQSVTPISPPLCKFVSIQWLQLFPCLTPPSHPNPPTYSQITINCPYLSSPLQICIPPVTLTISLSNPPPPPPYTDIVKLQSTAPISPPLCKFVSIQSLQLFPCLPPPSPPSMDQSPPQSTPPSPYSNHDQLALSHYHCGSTVSPPPPPHTPCMLLSCTLLQGRKEGCGKPVLGVCPPPTPNRSYSHYNQPPQVYLSISIPFSPAHFHNHISFSSRPQCNVCKPSCYSETLA